jgi:putative transposase
MDYLWLKATWDIPEISGSDSKRLDAIKKAFTNMAEKADRIFMDK